MKTKILILSLCAILVSCNTTTKLCKTTPGNSDLKFDHLATKWDEGIPLGNATIGSLVWKNKDALRMSLDRTDLWDLRPLDSLSGDRFKFAWLKQQIRNNNYGAVQSKFDTPYDREAAPSKIPGAALEFLSDQLNGPANTHLFINDALCEVTWQNGITMQTFVHATQPVGWFIFKNLKQAITPSIKTPIYQSKKETKDGNSLTGQSLERLGYQQGQVTKEENCLIYHQKGYGDFSYDVAVRWQQVGETLIGTWSISSSLSNDNAAQITAEAMKRGYKHDYETHRRFWQNFYAQSSVSLPDSILQKQYDNEMYKFGSAARENSYPISLQAVWTADNGHLPPWKGDYHHDLNTQLSYWPAYIGNHLTEESGYINTLWNQREQYRKFTRQYFETDGLNVPGVCTLDGQPMGGWVQYSMSQTTGAWIEQHFYLHWKYSADREFLKSRAYPFIKEVATYMEQQSYIDPQNIRRLEYSSSPEIYDNSRKAWFNTTTNYDLALMKFLFKAAAEAADSLKLDSEARHWRETGNQLPDFDLDNQGSLTFAKGFPYNVSHRHFSHAMAIHPLGLIDWSDGDKSRHIINQTIDKLKKNGSDYWVGYSFSWLGNMYARARNGEEAARTLRTFAECFCLPNTFHANGDQSGTGKSLFTYRPFTLEGNFAFAAGVQEMLLQSHTDTVRVFPAIPAEWKNVSFKQLRAMGGFLVNAEMKDGKISSLSVFSEQGYPLNIVYPGCNQALRMETRKGKWTHIVKQ